MRRKIFALALIAAFLLMLTVGTLTASASGGGCQKHYIKWGETLYSIGRMYDLAPWYIAQYNGIANPNYIQGGRVLCVPSYGPSYPGYHTYGYGDGYDHGAYYSHDYYGGYDHGAYYDGGYDKGYDHGAYYDGGYNKGYDHGADYGYGYNQYYMDYGHGKDYGYSKDYGYGKDYSYGGYSHSGYGYGR